VDGKLMPENFHSGQFLRKADKCFGTFIVTYSMGEKKER
jgi:hypothetical protein